MDFTSLNEENSLEMDKLAPGNKDYFSKFAGYLRSRKLVQSGLELEEMIAGMLSDLITALEKGSTAEEYFGKNPQALADELLENIDKMSSRRKLLFGAKLVVINASFALSNNIASEGGLDIPLVNYLLQLVLTLSFAFYILNLVNRSFYHKTNTAHKILSVAWGLTAIFLPGLFPELLIVHLSWAVSLMIYGSFLIVFANELRKDHSLLNGLGTGVLLFGIVMQIFQRF